MENAKKTIILIADSGSTKTEWVAIQQGNVVATIKTSGINPVYQQPAEIAADIKQNVVTTFSSLPIKQVFFYGAGCIPEKVDEMQVTLSGCFDTPTTVQSDLVGAAVALCGNEPGLASILGTGSNTCFWDGKKVIKNISPLGFILGDEGSGAVLGKLLIADILKNQISKEISDKFYAEYRLTNAEIIDRIYRQPFPNRFLASFTRFMHQNIQNEEIQNIIISNFVLFINRNVKQYDYHNHPLNAVGSVAHFFKNLLYVAAKQTGVTIGSVVQSPINGLIQFHTK